MAFGQTGGVHILKLISENRALTKRDLLNKLQKVEKALGTQSQRADTVERQNTALIAEIIQLKASAPVDL